MSEVSENYVGFITTTKSGRFRGCIGSLHDVGEDDGDRVVQDVASSEMYGKLDDAIVELTKQCKSAGITKICKHPRSRGQILFESELVLS